MKLLLVTLFVLFNSLITQQIPMMSQAYSTAVLRHAKAADIKAYMDMEKEPCENFYAFSCGNWKRFHPATLENKKSAQLEQLQGLYVRKSAQMLAEDGGNDNAIDLMLKDFYHSCQNKDAIKKQRLAPILKVVNFVGGWPEITSDTWYQYEYDWLRVVADVRRQLGIEVFIGLDIIPDFEDKFIHRIKVGAPELGLNLTEAYSVYWDDTYKPLREEYKQGISNTLKKYFPQMSHKWAEEVSDQVLYVEEQLAKGLPLVPKSIEQTTRQRYVSELKAAYGTYVDLNRYLNLVLNQTIYAQVYETPEDYFASLVTVIKETDKHYLANYTMWRVISEFDFDGDVSRSLNDDWCVQKILHYFPHQLETTFYRNYNGRIQMTNELNSLWAEIKKTFREELQGSNKLNWLTADVRQKAVLKLDAMELDFVMHDQEDFGKEMNGLVLHHDTYYENYISILQWDTRRKLAKLFEKPQLETTDVQLPQYQLTTNKIKIPITFLQARFFWDEAYPDALKYSTLGFLLAQEMIKGFDHVGRKYDKHGYQRNWWDTVSEYAFDEHASCFAKQYTKEKNLNETNALRTSIADHGGLAIAYRSYQKWWQYVADNKLQIEENLPLLDYTQNQLFFISFAQVWCADYHNSVKDYMQLPESVRVKGALTNLPEFANEFKCDKGAKMNPEKKCNVY